MDRPEQHFAQVENREKRPDLLCRGAIVPTESLTYRGNTGLNLSVPKYLEVIQFVLKDLHRGSVVLGAGSWYGLSCFQGLSEKTSLDYLDLPIYPLPRDFLIERTQRTAERAHTHYKELGIGETWLYSIRQRNGNSSAWQRSNFASLPKHLRFLDPLGPKVPGGEGYFFPTFSKAMLFFFFGEALSVRLWGIGGGTAESAPFAALPAGQSPGLRPYPS